LDYFLGKALYEGHGPSHGQACLAGQINGQAPTMKSILGQFGRTRGIVLILLGPEPGPVWFG